MTVVDASVWVSRFVPADIHHRLSCGWIERHVRAGGRIVAPGLLLAEVVGAVARRTGRPSMGHRVLEQLLAYPAMRLVTIDPILAEAAAHLAADLSLRGANAVYVATAQRLSTPLVTLDREMRERARRLVDAREPTAEGE